MRVTVVQQVPARISPAVVKKVFAAAGRVQPRYVHADVSVAFVSDAASRRLNRRYRRRDRPTDVLSFSELDSRHVFSPQGNYLGDIVIAVPYVARQAKRLGHPYREEVVTLLVHGFLHLIGHDHHRTMEAVRMKRQESRILARLKNSEH